LAWSEPFLTSLPRMVLFAICLPVMSFAATAVPELAANSAANATSNAGDGSRSHRRGTELRMWTSCRDRGRVVRPG
jgi:hypothetical protein